MDEPVTPTDPAEAEAAALRDALAGLLAQVARLAVARGLPAAPVEEMLRTAFVEAAAAAHPGLPEHRKVSRIATTTGLNRREVTRLVSFEALVQQVTRDVHPRSLLDELVRLGLVRWDADSDTVALASEAFVARGDAVRQLGYLGHNVGDHLHAAVDNVIASANGEGTRHFEQAVLAWGLSAESLALLQPVIRAQWRALEQALVPLLRERVGADANTDPTPPGRIRVGLYSYEEGAAAAPAAAPARAVRARVPRPASRKTRE